MILVPKYTQVGLSPISRRASVNSPYKPQRGKSFCSLYIREHWRYQLLSSFSRTPYNIVTISNPIGSHMEPRHMVSRPPSGVRYNPQPSADQLQKRSKYQETVDAVATLNSVETRSILQKQSDAKRFDSSVLVDFAGMNNNQSSNWTSVPIAPPKPTLNSKGGRRSVDPVVIDLGFERPFSQQSSNAINLDDHHEETMLRHNSLMCTINHLDTINEKFARKSPRPVKSEKEALNHQKKALGTPLDKRIETLQHACESAFNEEMKMKAHHADGAHDDHHSEDDEHIVEYCKWIHRRATQHTMKMFICAIATLNQNGSDQDDNSRMVDLLKHQSEIGELYLIAILIRDNPYHASCMGITKATTLPQRCKHLLKIAHEIHRILVSASGSAKHLKLKDISRIFIKEILDLRDALNTWDEKQVIRFSRLTRSISSTGLMPFTRAPTAAEIKAAQDHQDSLHNDEKNAILRAYKNRDKKKMNNDNDRSRRYHEGDDDDVSSVSSSGSSSGSESIGTAESRDRLINEIQRAKHDTPFIAGGKVMYAPRRPHTRGSRALTGMEMDVIPLVTGARDSVEHATSLSSPRRKPHPSWTPHVKLTPHPTFGNKYHGHHLHVHHHHHGHDWKEKNKKFDDRHDENGKIIHKHHHHRHSSHGNGGGHHHHKRKHPKTLRECLLSHETDVSVLVQAYKTEQLKFPPSWKEAAEKAEKEAQQVKVLRDEKKTVEETKHHNVYEMEAHGKPPSKHRVYQNLVDTAQRSMKNSALKKFSTGSYKRVLALSINQGKTNSDVKKLALDNACFEGTVEHGLYIQGLNAVAARTRLMKYQREQEEQERLRPGRRPKNSAFSKAVRIPSNFDIQKAKKKREEHNFVDEHRLKKQFL